jgi:hypothetical protein
LCYTRFQDAERQETRIANCDSRDHSLRHRKLIESKYYMPSLEALEQRVARLPHGSKLRFSPYKRDHFGRPIIFATGEFA